MNRKQMAKKAKAERKSALSLRVALEKAAGIRKDEAHRVIRVSEKK